MHVPTQDSLRGMYMWMRAHATILLRCICQARTVFGSCICAWGFLPLLYYDVCAKPGQCSRDVYVNESSCHYSIKRYCPTQDKCSGHVYVNEVSCHYSIKMYVPNQDSVRVIYIWMRAPAPIPLRCMCQARTVFESFMCMRVPATILLRCLLQARTVFGSCICVWGFLPLLY